MASNWMEELRMNLFNECLAVVTLPMHNMLLEPEGTPGVYRTSSLHSKYPEISIS